MSVNLSADRVGSTWIWDTRNVWCWRSHNLWVFVAVEEWVSAVSLGTAAYGVVVDHLALGVGSAGPGTGVNTLLLDTSLTELTFRREQALWSAVGRAPEIAREAGTHRARTLRPALTIWSTWVRITRVCWLLDYWFSRLATTRREGVTDVSLWTAADGVVVDNVTLGVDSTNSNTWVLAAKIDTGKAWSTLAVDDTLWAASRRSSKVAREASAHWPAFLLSTVRIGTTRGWLAWVNGLCWTNYLRDGRTLGEWISCVS
jgi:hypothetical protein